MTVAVVLVAGGSGQRLGGDRPKQYQMLGGKPMACHALAAFLEHPQVDILQPVIRKEDIEHWKEVVAYVGTSKKLLSPVIGGATRQESVYEGLKALQSAAPDQVLIHDAARPFVSPELIARVVEKLARADAVIPVVDVTDTIKQVKDEQVVATLNRATLRRVQTPQGFTYSKIVDAHRRYEGRNFTDDAMVAEQAGMQVQLVAGEEQNVKITTAEDIQRYGGAGIRVGTGFDVHAFEPATPARKLMIGGVAIPHTHTLAGHSDADVALHALVDALLGALGMGDIGEHFPPSDPQWKNADSAKFVEYVRKQIEARGAEIEHVDLTIICEAPKITPHKAAMRARIAELLAVEESRVNVKATTTEKLGFTGRGEGIAAQAVATIRG